MLHEGLKLTRIEPYADKQENAGPTRRSRVKHRSA